MPLIRGKLDNRRALIDVGLQPTIQTTEGVTPVSQTSDFTIRRLRGLLDTGAQGTCVTRSTARSIGLMPRGKKLLGNVSSFEMHTAFSFVLGVWYIEENGGPNNQTTGYYGFEPILGCDFKDNPDFDVLIGMDIISQGDFSTKRNGDFEWFLP